MYIDVIKLKNPENKRYGLYFRQWWNLITTEKDYLRFSKRFCDTYFEKVEQSFEYFDTLEELREASRLYEEVYGGTNTPNLVPGYRDNCGFWVKEHYLFEDDSKFWGYALLDIEECRILSIHGDLKKVYPWKLNKKDYSYLELLDRLFRKPGEVPENYKWDNGEYEGWLQFRWGNGLNAIGREEPRKEKKNSPKNIEFCDIELEDNTIDHLELEDKFDKEIQKEIESRKLNHW